MFVRMMCRPAVISDNEFGIRNSHSSRRSVGSLIRFWVNRAESIQAVTSPYQAAHLEGLRPELKMAARDRILNI